MLSDENYLNMILDQPQLLDMLNGGRRHIGCQNGEVLKVLGNFSLNLK